MQETAAVLGGRYELGEELGDGGMAEVFAATDRVLDRRVAVKVLAEPYRRDRAFVERFRREAASAAKLLHPNIATVYDSGSTDGSHYLVMELVDGETLADRLRQQGPMDAAESVRIGSAVARALAEAHRHGIVHRDVKPGNVMLAADGIVKVVDFGIAHASGAQRATRSGLVLGSACYLSPEQAQGAAGDPRSDVYGLGCTLHEMLTGRPPFTGDDPVAVLYQHVNQAPPPLSSDRPVPAELERIVERCLEKDPDRRFATAEELERALRAVPFERRGDTLPMPAVEDAPTEPIPRRSPSPASGRRWWPIAIVAMVVLLGGLAALAVGSSDPPSLRPAREARQEALALAEGTIGAGPVADAYAALVSSIRAGAVVGEIGGQAAAELTDRAERILDAYAIGDVDAIVDQAVGLRAAVGNAVQDETMSATAAEAVLERLDALTTAMSDASVAPVAPEEEEPVTIEDDDADHGDGSHGNGPPPHAEANGHDDGSDD